MFIFRDLPNKRHMFCNRKLLVKDWYNFFCHYVLLVVFFMEAKDYETEMGEKATAK